MIKIEKDGTNFIVSRGAYETYFKSIGYKESRNLEPKKNEEVEIIPEEKEPEKKEEEVEIETVSRRGKKDLKVGDKK